MQNNRSDILQPGNPSGIQFRIYAAVILLSLFTGLTTGWYFLAGLPALLIIIYLGLVDFRAVFFFLLFCIPLSTEIQLPNGFGTDLPTEPLMVGLMLIYFFYLLANGKELGSAFLRHPITLLLLLHFSWIIITTITSGETFISVKYLLAKTWYIIVFFFLAGLLLKTRRDFYLFFWAICLPLTFTICVVLFRHGLTGFNFANVHQVLNPFYRNHVAYASIMVVFFPFILLFRQWYEKGSLPRRMLNFLAFLFLVAIYLAYTRAAYVALIIAGGAFLVIHLRLTRYVLILATIAAIVTVVLFAENNRFLDLAPDYERTVTHQKFENLLEATYQGEDISTMERVYRWIAGFYMSGDKPVFGFGPGNFVPFYRPYTVNSFQTYVSDNVEQSGIHSYYLMILVEQGFPGLFFFLLLIFFTLIKGENLYHRMRNTRQKQAVLAILSSMIIILSLLIINDLIETDKIGPFFFMNLAFLINLDLRSKKERHDG